MYFLEKIYPIKPTISPFFILRLKGISKHEEEIYTPDFLERYSAHLHINILSDYQGRGLGERLMGVFEDRIRKLDVSGIHLITSTENKKAVLFYRKMGYEVIKELPDILWDRKSPVGTKSLVFGKRLHHKTKDLFDYWGQFHFEFFLKASCFLGSAPTGILRGRFKENPSFLNRYWHWRTLN